MASKKRAPQTSKSASPALPLRSRTAGIRAAGGLSRTLLQGACFPLGATLGLALVGAPARAQDPAAAPAPAAEAPATTPAEAPAAADPATAAPAPAAPVPAAPTPVSTDPLAKVPAAPAAGLQPARMAQAPATMPGASDGVSASSKDPALVLPTVKVEGKSAEYHTPDSQLTRVATPLVNLPQQVTLVPKEVMEEQRAVTVRDALRNVSGITVTAGEGGRQGDTFILRGFSGQNDTFRDGARDLGWFTRDTFNLEGVEVFFGPSAVLFGRGSTGGAINLVTKAPKRGTFAQATLSGGSAPSGRIEADVNDSLSDGVQVRASAMIQQGKVVGRDGIDTNRAGFAPSARFQLGSKTFLGLDYLYQRERGIPDYGQPFYNGKPVSKGYGVSRNAFYGVPGVDKEDVDAHIATGRLESGLAEGVKFTNTTRLGSVDRMAIPTAPRNLAPVVDPTTIGRNRFQSETDYVNVINQSDFRFQLETGFAKHAANLGVEVSWERRKQTRYNLQQPGTGNAVNVTADLRNPSATPDLSKVNSVFSSYQRGRMTNVGFYVADQISLHKAVEVLGSVRLDRFATDHRSFGADGVIVSLKNDDLMVNYRGGLVLHPMDKTSLYGMVGTSSNPSAEAGTLSDATVSLDPEKNVVYEIGAKAELLEDRLGLGASVFRIQKQNARVPGTDPMGPPTILDGEQRVQGFNVGLSGAILENWKLIGNYTFLKSRIAKHSSAYLVGQALPGAAPHGLSLWSTVTVAKKLTLGGGSVFVSETVANNPANAQTLLNKVPGYVRFDAFASYAGWKNLDLQLNVSNLTNALYYSEYSGAQAVPAEGRMVLVTARMRI